MDKKLLEIAKENIKYSYSPYSKYRVISVIRTKTNKYFYGVNIENSSYSLTMCAERVAIFKAISEGEMEFEEMLVYSQNKNKPYPCGACLQVMSEFVKDDFIINIANDSEIEEYKFSQLFPKKFKL